MQLAGGRVALLVVLSAVNWVVLKVVNLAVLTAAKMAEHWVEMTAER